jgi:hypothetical protein
MSGGQHRDDEVNGPSQSGERGTKDSRDRGSNQQALQGRQTGVREKSKNQDETFLTEPTSLEMLINPVGVEKAGFLKKVENRAIENVQETGENSL